jgi:hypothetical protein
VTNEYFPDHRSHSGSAARRISDLCADTTRGFLRCIILLFQIALYLLVLTAIAVPLGKYMARVLSGERHILSAILGPLEKLVLRIAGVRADQEMHWKQYALALIAFNLTGALAVYLLQRVQGYLPFNPQQLAAVSLIPLLILQSASLPTLTGRVMAVNQP